MLEISETVYRMDTVNSDGKTDLFIEAIIITVRDREMDSFTIQRTQVSVEVFGKKESFKARANTFRPRETGSSAFGAKAK